MTHPYQIKFRIYNGNERHTRRQKEIANSFYCYEFIKDIVKDIFRINSKYKFIETTHSIGSHDEKKQLRIVHETNFQTKNSLVHFIQYCESSYFCMNELKYISELLHFHLQNWFDCRLEPPIIYLPNQYAKEDNTFITELEYLLDDKIKNPSTCSVL